MTKTGNNTRYQLKLSLEGIEPPVWRRLLVPAHCSMEALHCAIQTAMGWEDEHLYAFDRRKGRKVLRRVEIPDPDDMWDPAWHTWPRPEDSASVRLGEFAVPGDVFYYIYDFGDNWTHTIRAEKAVEEATSALAGGAECADGARACPPENCGGVRSHAGMLDALKNPEQARKPEIRERLEWLGEWDAEAFDVRAVNRALMRWTPDQRGHMYTGICDA